MVLVALNESDAALALKDVSRDRADP